MRITTLSVGLTLPLALALALGLSACDGAPGPPGGEAAASDTSAEAADLVRVEFTVAGMDCAGCVIAARAALRRLDGVEEADAAFESIEASPAWVRYDPEQIAPERMIEALEALGYTATVAEKGS